jgi:hypothetical protein
MPTSGPDLKINELASQLSALPYVEAVILGGSISTGMVDDRSDCDLSARHCEPHSPDGGLAGQLL